MCDLVMFIICEGVKIGGETKRFRHLCVMKI